MTTIIGWLIRNRVAICLVAVVVLVSGALYWKGHHDGSMAGTIAALETLNESQAQTVAALKVGAEALNKRLTEIDELRDQSDEDAMRIAKLRGAGRVRCGPASPPNRLPKDSDSDLSGDDRAGGEDATEFIEQCLRTFGQVNRATTPGDPK